MNPTWKTFLEAAGARFDGDLVADFGNAQAERQAVASDAVLSPIPHLGVIACSGEDAQAFLHNQFTSDIKRLKVDGAQNSAWCTAKGRMLASLLVWREADSYQLALSADLLAPVLKRLKMFVLRSKVTLADRSDEVVLLGLGGKTANAALDAAGYATPALPLEVTDIPGGKLIRLEDAPDGPRYQIAVLADAAPAVWQALAARARPAGTPVWQWLAIQAGIPLITAATQEAFVPQMANFERIGGVSFQKGCYPGQEIVARTQYLGKVKRSLYRAKSPVAVAAGTALFSGLTEDGQGGAVVNAAPAADGAWELLAVIPDTCAADGPVSIGAVGGATLELLPLPYTA